MDDEPKTNGEEVIEEKTEETTTEEVKEEAPAE